MMERKIKGKKKGKGKREKEKQKASFLILFYSISIVNLSDLSLLQSATAAFFFLFFSEIFSVFLCIYITSHYIIFFSN